MIFEKSGVVKISALCILSLLMVFSLASCQREVLKNSATIIIRDGFVIMTYYDQEVDAVHDWENVKNFLKVVLDNHSQKEILVIIEKVPDPRALSSYAVRRVIRFLKKGGAVLDIQDERQGLRLPDSA